MNKLYKSLTLVFLISIFISVSLISAQEGLPIDTPKSPGLVVTEPVPSLAEQQAALAYWTRERNLAAQPMPIPIDFTSRGVDFQAIAEQDKLAGPPGYSPAGLPAPNADAIAQADYPQEWAALEDDASLGSAEQSLDFYSAEGMSPDALEGTSQEYTAYFVKNTADTKEFPHKWVGRVASSGGTCSGTAISNNHLLTAAHCVYNTVNNTWFANKVFQPAYRAGATPYGTFATTGCTILTSYVNLSGTFNIGTWSRHDVAVCDLGLNSSGKTLNQMVGWAGREWNWPYNRHFHEMGFPSRNYQNTTIPDAGKYLHLCIAESFQYTTDVRGMGCNMGPGVSGGPWMKNYGWRAIGGNVSGVNSGLIINQQNLYAPRFSSSNIIPICNQTGC